MAEALGVEAQQEQLAAWQRVNTALYWHLVPAIDIDGPYYTQEQRVCVAILFGVALTAARLSRE